MFTIGWSHPLSGTSHSNGLQGQKDTAGVSPATACKASTMHGTSFFGADNAKTYLILRFQSCRCDLFLNPRGYACTARSFTCAKRETLSNPFEPVGRPLFTCQMDTKTNCFFQQEQMSEDLEPRTSSGTPGDKTSSGYSRRFSRLLRHSWSKCSREPRWYISGVRKVRYGLDSPVTNYPR